MTVRSEARAKAALRRRVFDILLGATSEQAETFIGNEEQGCDSIAFTAGLEDWIRFVGALRREFGGPKSDNGKCAFFWFEVGPNLEKFDTLQGAVDVLFEQGVRA